MSSYGEDVVVPSDPDYQTTVAMYDRVPAAFARHLAGFRSCVPDIERAHALAGVALGESRVVEIGCGEGRDAETAFVPNSGQYIGYDPSAGMLKLARLRFPTSPEDMFRLGYAQTTDYPADQDIMIAVSSVLHISHRDLPAMYERIAAGLRRGGVFYGITKVDDRDKVEVYHDHFGGETGERTFYHHSPETLTGQAARSGLALAYQQRAENPNAEWDWYAFAVARTA